MKSSMNFKEALEKNTENIEVQSDMFQKIMKEIEGEEQMKLKQLKKTKTLIIACTALVISSATAFAAAKYIQYSTPPSTQEVREQIGFSPKYIESFSNGYSYLTGGVDEDFKLTDGSNDLEIRYEKDNALVHYHAVKAIKGETTLADFEKSADPQDTIESLTLSQKIPAIYLYSEKYSYLYWEEDQILYSLGQLDHQLNKDDLVKMANELIEK